MTLFRRTRAFIRNVVQRESAERELDAELRAFVELLTDQKIRAGADPVVARRLAMIEAGGVEQVKEQVRDARTGAWLDGVCRDISHAVRGLRRAPGFTIAVVATLAIGIGLNSALFTVVYSALARPLPVRDPGDVVNIYQRLHSGGPRGREVRGNNALISYAEYLEYAKLPALATSAVFHSRTLNIDGETSGPIAAELVSCNYFRTLRTRVVLGRDFTDDECARLGDGPVVVISDATWRAHYGADSSVVGRTIQVNGLPVKVVGVAEPRFNGVAYQPAALWMPLTMQPALDHGRDSIITRENASWLTMVARLSPAATLDEAQGQAQVVARRLDATHAGRKIDASVVRGALVNFPIVASEGAVPIALVMLLGFTIVALACANVVNLSLSRGLARQREVAIRLAIGASRAQLVQQLLIESALVAAVGSAVGFAFVLAVPRTIAALTSLIGDFQLDASPDARVIAYIFAVAIGATLLIGVAPALQATRVDLASAFKGGMTFGRRTIRPARLRGAVVGVQLGGSAVLLVLSALFVRAARHATTTDPGYATKNVVAFQINASAIGYDTAQARRLYTTLIDRLRQLPTVAGVAMVGKLPLLSTNRMGVSLAEDAAPNPELHVVDVAFISGSYFSTMSMRIIRGSTFDSTALMSRDREAVVSEAMAERLWPSLEAIGHRFNAAGRTYRVVGIASNAAANTLARTNDAVAYLEPASPLGQQIVVRTTESPAGVIAALPAWLHEIDPRLNVQTERFENRIALHLLPARVVAGSTATLGALALVLAAIGVAGVVSFGLGQRRQEVAVRLAVGATGAQVVTLMMQQATRPIVIGIGAGLAIAIGIAQVMRGFLYGLSPADPATYALMATVLALTALVATWVPSRRAARVDPATVLRDS